MKKEVKCKDCDNITNSPARGLCGTCYTRFYRKDGKVDRSIEKRIKPLCHPDRKLAPRGLCDPCYRQKLINEKSPEEIARKKHRLREVHIKTRYGIDIVQYNELLRQQNYKCLGCEYIHSEQNHKTRLHIDHDHKTNKIRGLLCNSCNTAIGYAKDNKIILQNLINYLVQHEEQTDE